MATTVKKQKKTALNGAETQEKLSKKEIQLRKLAEKLQKISAKYEVKPFDRKVFYANN